MNDIAKTYERFARILLDGQITSGTAYRTLCRQLHVHPDDLDDYLLVETGFTGDELMAWFGI